MTEQVTKTKLYHITLTTPYKQGFTLNQQIRVGDTDNPFFAFYENAREYGITDHKTDVVIQVKAVAWLRLVREGKIGTTALILADIASEVAVHYVMLCRELLMEDIRKAEFNGEPPSRQRCLYAGSAVLEQENRGERHHLRAYVHRDNSSC